MNQVILYRKHASGVGLGTWRIFHIGNRIHIMHATVMGGSEVQHTEVVEKGLGGRTLDQQIASRIASRVSKMLDKGYKRSMDEALESNGNQLGLLRPMLAQSLAKVNNVNYKNAVLQKKLDGHRCLITKDDGKIIAYSRQGKIIDTIGHITNPLQHIIAEGETFDGELYCHGQPLQTLASWIKRKQPATKSLRFVCYDYVSDDDYIDRWKYIYDKLNLVENTLVLPHIPYQGQDHMSDYLKTVRNQGFEGLMLRTAGRGYEDGVRSSSLIKVKVFEDAEVRVVDVIPSSDGWAICVVTYNGRKFNVSAPGDMSAKHEVMRNADKYIGKLLTIEFSHITNEGIPFHATAKRWREDV